MAELVDNPRQLSSTDFASIVASREGFVGPARGECMDKGDGIRGYEGG